MKTIREKRKRYRRKKKAKLQGNAMSRTEEGNIHCHIVDSGVECQQSMPSDTSSSHSSDIRWREVNEEAAVIQCMATSE